MTQSELERKAHVQKELIRTLLKYHIVGEFTEEGFASAVETILNQKTRRQAELDYGVRKRAKLRRAS